MSIVLASAARATTGARSGQEDAFQLWPADGVARPEGESGGLLAVLADGMGGHTGGAVAGQTACSTFAEVFAAAASPTTSAWSRHCNASNEALAKGVEENAALRGMGCTIVAAWMDTLGIRWASVGDSLLLLYRFPDVIRLNADHSLGSFLDEQARQNRISASEAKQHQNRNALRSALTGSKIDLVDLRSEPLELQAGDWILIASDGICSLEGDEIADVVYNFRQSSPAEMADGLIAAVVRKNVAGQDNTTVVAIRVDPAKVATDADTTRVLRGRGKEEKELRSRRIGMTGRKTSIPRSASRAARAHRHMVRGGRGLLPFLCRGDPAAIAAIDDDHHYPRDDNVHPARAGRSTRAGACSPGCPRYDGSRRSSAANSRRPRADAAGRASDDGPRVPDATRATEGSSADAAKKRSRACKSDPRPFSKQPPCRLRRRLLRIRKRCLQSLRHPRRPAANPAKDRRGLRALRKRGGKAKTARNRGENRGRRRKDPRTGPRKCLKDPPKDVLPWGFSND